LTQFLQNRINNIMLIFALLLVMPPLWEDVAQLKAILNAPELGEHADAAAVVEGIDRTDSGWEIRTNKGDVKVRVISEPQAMPGPKKFSLEFAN
jgi:hypothetical protein